MELCAISRVFEKGSIIWKLLGALILVGSLSGCVDVDITVNVEKSGKAEIRQFTSFERRAWDLMDADDQQSICNNKVEKKADLTTIGQLRLTRDRAECEMRYIVNSLENYDWFNAGMVRIERSGRNKYRAAIDLTERRSDISNKIREGAVDASFVAKMFAGYSLTAKVKAPLIAQATKQEIKPNATEAEFTIPMAEAIGLKKSAYDKIEVEFSTCTPHLFGLICW
jgi:hypothetical protein